MKQAHGFSVGVLLAAAVFAGGCASSQMSRIDQNRDIYEKWPLEIRQAVLDGKVEAGMTPEMVSVAWGKPSEVVTQSKNGDEIWVFKRGGNSGDVYYPAGSYPSGNYPGSGVYGGGGPGIGISTGRGGTAIGATGGVGIGMGGGMGGPVIGPTGGMGGLGGPIVTPPTPPEIREVVFRNGVVLKADLPFEK
jgi:hypothetical protein